MCRIAAYLGPEAPLSSLLFDPPHSLDHQAYAPREMLHGTVNVDGTGIAWWADEPQPLRYVTEKPPWADPNLPELSRRLKSKAILATVRSAAPGLGHGASDVAPFTRGTLAGAHNGHIEGFRGPIGRALLDGLPESVFGEFDVMNDSRLLFLAMSARVEAGAGLGDALLETLAEVRAVCRSHGTFATLNVVLTDGVQLVAVRTSENVGINSLYTSRGDGETLIASEPLDAVRQWEPVPDHVMVEANGTDFKFTDLEDIA